MVAPGPARLACSRSTRRTFLSLAGAGFTSCLGACKKTAQPPAGTGSTRLVSTAPSITETLFALGAGKQVVGVTDFCHYPPEVRALPKIGSFLNPSPESILNLRPTLVIILKNPIRLGERLQSLGLNVLEVSTDSISDVEVAMKSISSAIGMPARGEALVAEVERQLAHIRAVTSPLPRKRIAFIVGRNPGALEGMVAVGASSYHGDLMRTAGTENIFSSAASQYPKISIEEILARDPEVLVDMGDMTMTDNVTEEHKRSVVKLWQRYPTVTAVKEHAVFAVASDIYVVPGPRVVDAAREIARLAHPEVSL